ncbi:uncharacterized protein PV09_08202 [Verruconis gallopava]|uniref:Glycerate dehydrogenase n=1 Tax=Verruconis gallopava TaxID=253628 RepID=A0A0D2A1W1_9PEZI|nr:uncharacterized protein PV09_08202 [Verruconis gallopava]KIW00315.1 hypothetical protein PV09_08202 [Verruconis gallopava]
MAASQSNLKSENHHHIVALEAHFCPIPEFKLPSPYTYTLETYPKTLKDQIPERIRDASIVITTTIRLDASVLSAEISPKLQLIAVMATGTDSVDLKSCMKRGIVVCRCAGANVTAVSEHAIGMYFATRRKFYQTQTATRGGQWPLKGSLIPILEDRNKKMPLTCEEETIGLIGYGKIGQRIGRLAKLLGMKVIVAERKGAKCVREGRTAFDEVLRDSTVLAVVIPRNPETIGLIGQFELSRMSSSAVLINVSRGDIVDESAVVHALQTHQIAGAAFDVFSQEPANSSTSPLLAADTEGLNVLTTPHTAWLANATMTSLQRMVREAVEGWCAGKPVQVVV